MSLLSLASPSFYCHFTSLFHSSMCPFPSPAIPTPFPLLCMYSSSLARLPPPPFLLLLLAHLLHPLSILPSLPCMPKNLSLPLPSLPAVRDVVELLGIDKGSVHVVEHHDDLFPRKKICTCHGQETKCTVGT
jgi:hypothetical protein